MSDAALLGWGMMIGSWLTSLWIMRKDTKSAPNVQSIDAARSIFDGLYLKTRLAEKVAPECAVSATQRITVNGRSYRLTLRPIMANEEETA